MQAIAVDRFFIWDEVCGEVYDIAIPAELIAKAKNPKDLIAAVANWLMDGCFLHPTDPWHEYDKQEISQVGDTTVLRGRFGRNLSFGMYLGEGAEELAQKEFSEFPG